MIFRNGKHLRWYRKKSKSPESATLTQRLTTQKNKIWDFLRNHHLHNKKNIPKYFKLPLF